MLDRLTDVRNFGAISRTAECVGVDAIIIPEKGAAPINSDAIKTSAGALYNVKICKEKNLAHSVDFLQQSGIKVLQLQRKLRNLSMMKTSQSLYALLWGMRKQESPRKSCTMLMKK